MKVTLKSLSAELTILMNGVESNTVPDYDVAMARISELATLLKTLAPELVDKRLK